MPLGTRSTLERAGLTAADLRSPRERIRRNSFLLGFTVLLVLILGDGAISYQKMGAIADEVRIGSAQNAHDLRVALDLHDATGRLKAEWNTYMVTGALGGYMQPAHSRMREIEASIDEKIAGEEGLALSETDEWKAFVADYRAFVADIEARQAMPPEGDEAFEKLQSASHALVRRVEDNAERLDEESRQKRSGAQRDIVLTTAVCLAAGLAISILSFLDTRRRVRVIEDAFDQLYESRAFSESVLEGMDSAIVTVDTDGAVSGINDPALYVLGHGGDAIGRNIRDVLADHPGLLAVVEPAISAPPSMRRYLGRAEAGRGHWLFDVGVAPLGGAHGAGFILTLTDVTEAERANEELRRNRALSAVGQMTAQVAHEIKNPLGGIRLAAQVLERKLAGDEQGLAVVARIQSSVDHLARTVGELNQFARPSELALEPVRLDELMDDLLLMVGDKVESKRIVVERSYRPNMPDGLFDPGELRKALINFLVNALEASPDGSRLFVTVDLVTGSPDEARVVVRDEGSGMSAETVRRLFEPFYTTKSQGTGLGMSIARKIIEQHKGRLDVASEEGRGTEVVVTLPLLDRALVPAPGGRAPEEARK